MLLVHDAVMVPLGRHADVLGIPPGVVLVVEVAKTGGLQVDCTGNSFTCHSIPSCLYIPDKSTHPCNI